jgi:zinc protease
MLVEQLRDEKQLVSGVSAEDDTPSYGSGTFGVEMQLDADKVNAATTAALKILGQIQTQPISEDRIKRAKTQMLVERVRSQQTAEEVASTMAEDLLLAGDPHFSDHYIDRIQTVTASELQDVARRYLDRDRLLTTLMLPTEAVGAGGLAKAQDLIRPAVPATQASGPELAGQIQRVQLDNGVILLLKRITTSPLVVMNMYSQGGVTAEDESTNGLGNLTMELLQRGTTKRNAEQIAEFFDSVGGQLATSTGNNSWIWTASCLKGDFEKTLEVYGDVVNHPAFPDSEIGPMKQRIAAAIQSEDADWDRQTVRYFKQQYFGPSHSPYQFLPIGTRENVAKFTADQIRQWYTQKILAGRRVLAIFGDIDIDQAQSLAAQYMGGGQKASEITVAPGPFVPVQPQPGPPSVEVLDVKVQKTEQALAGIMIGYKSDSVIGDPADDALAVGQTMAGGWQYPTGYLFETLRGKGLVYVVENQNVPGRSAAIPGAYFALAGCGPSKVNEVVEQILLNIARLQGTPADMQEDWFARSKLLITTADAMEHETPDEQATTAALDEMFGLGFNYHQQFAGKIDAVTIDQVRQVAAARLRQCIVTICTPDPDSVNIKAGLRTYNSFPTVDLTPRGVQHDIGAPKP